MSKTYTEEDIKIGTEYIYGDSFYDEKNPFQTVRLLSVKVLDIKDGYVLFGGYGCRGITYSQMSESIELFIGHCNLGEKQKENCNEYENNS